MNVQIALQTYVMKTQIALIILVLTNARVKMDSLETEHSVPVILFNLT